MRSNKTQRLFGGSSGYFDGAGDGVPSWRKRIKPEHRYIHKVLLPPHESQVNSRDPRKVWCYDVGIERVSVDIWSNNQFRMYRFAYEDEAALFVMRWGGEISVSEPRS